jgi:hypothetical protein
MALLDVSFKDVIGIVLLLTTPTRVSSISSNGPWLFEIDMQLAAEQVPRPAPISRIVRTTPQSVSAPTAGHWAVATPTDITNIARSRTVSRVQVWDRTLLDFAKGVNDGREANAMLYSLTAMRLPKKDSGLAWRGRQAEKKPQSSTNLGFERAKHKSQFWYPYVETDTFRRTPELDVTNM